MERSRADHLAWAQARALEYLDRSVPDVRNAIASILSDLRQHPETAKTADNKNIVAIGLTIVRDDDERRARKYIEGFR